MKMLAGLKDAFSPKALKTALHAMAGGGAAGLAHVVLVKEVKWFGEGEYAYAKRIGLAALLGTVGAQLVGKKSQKAADGVTGAMGAVIAYEIYNKVRKPDAAVAGLLSNLARTSVLTEGSRGGAVAGTKVFRETARGGFAGVGTQARMAGTY